MKKIAIQLLALFFMRIGAKELAGIQFVEELTWEEQGSYFQWHHLRSDMPPTTGLSSITFCLRFQILAFKDSRPAPTTSSMYTAWGPELGREELFPPIYWPDRHWWGWHIYDPLSRLNTGFDSELASLINMNPNDGFQFVFNTNVDHINIMEWHHVCMGYDTLSRNYSHFQNGKKQAQFKQGYTVGKVSEFKNLTLGRTMWGGDPLGIITDMNVWNTLLSDQDMIDFTTCKEMSKGTHFPWNIDQWHINETLERKGKIRKVSINEEELCQQDLSKKIELFKPDGRGFNWDSSDKLCRTFQGQLYKPPESMIEYNWQAEEFYRLLKTYPHLVHEYWMRGITEDYTHEDGDVPLTQYTWIDPLDNRVLQIPPETILPEWVRYPEPSRKCYRRHTCWWGEFDSCYNGRGVTNQHRCSRVLGGAACSFKQPVLLTLRGLCSQTKFDTTFRLLDPLEHTKDRGFGGSYGGSLQRNNESLYWKITSPDNHRHALYTGQKLYPLGRNTWEVTNDTCTGTSTTRISLILTACKTDQFTCDDGLCVSMEKRCDTKQDCEDLSDEKGCRFVYFDREKYLKDIPPPPPLPQRKNIFKHSKNYFGKEEHNKDAKGKSNKLKVELKVDLIKILKIDEVNNVFTTQFKLDITWKDSRLKFWNLKIDQKMNILTEKEKWEIWIPKLVFHNTVGKHGTFDDEKLSLSIIKHGSFKHSGIETQDNINIFEGNENDLVSERIYDMSWICEYDMTWYPFDTQKCSMEFQMSGRSGEFVQLVGAELVYSGPQELTKYFIRKRVMNTTRLDNGMFGVVVEVSLGRRLLATLLTVYLPTILLNIIGHCTNYFKDFFFESIIAVNLTCMLVLTNMFIGVSNNLPETSYIRMIDIWLIFNLCLPFIEVLLHTYIEMMTNEDIREINHHGAAVTVEDDKKKEDRGVTYVDNFMKEDSEDINARSLVGKNGHIFPV